MLKADTAFRAGRTGLSAAVAVFATLPVGSALGLAGAISWTGHFTFHRVTVLIAAGVRAIYCTITELGLGNTAHAIPAWTTVCGTVLCTFPCLAEPVAARFGAIGRTTLVLLADLAADAIPTHRAIHRTRIPIFTLGAGTIPAHG